ncbi:MAG TPA: 50S ribosomal protein L35 [Candidatus Binatia bacterium]|nr:50S ribosomal protein L35 [Candidatus Binatia bacterium]
MPKIRNHRGTKKRFRLTAGGRVMRRHAMQSHNLSKKSSKRKRLFAGETATSLADSRHVRHNAPYLSGGD